MPEHPTDAHFSFSFVFKQALRLLIFGFQRQIFLVLFRINLFPLTVDITEWSEGKLQRRCFADARSSHEYHVKHRSDLPAFARADSSGIAYGRGCCRHHAACHELQFEVPVLHKMKYEFLHFLRKNVQRETLLGNSFGGTCKCIADGECGKITFSHITFKYSRMTWAYGARHPTVPAATDR